MGQNLSPVSLGFTLKVIIIMSIFFEIVLWSRVFSNMKEHLSILGILQNHGAAVDQK